MAGQNMMAIAALATAGVALIVVIISMATDYWVSIGSTSIGLWKVCASAFGIRTCVSLPEPLLDWFKATQAAVCLDFIANLGGVVALGLLTFVSTLPEKIMKLLALVLMGVAIFWSFIAIVVFGAEQKTALSWSWGIMILAAILQIVSLVLTIFVNRSE